jgi:ankyrin repeat protein
LTLLLIGHSHSLFSSVSAGSVPVGSAPIGSVSVGSYSIPPVPTLPRISEAGNVQALAAPTAAAAAEDVSTPPTRARILTFEAPQAAPQNNSGAAGSITGAGAKKMSPLDLAIAKRKEAELLNHKKAGDALESATAPLHRRSASVRLDAQPFKSSPRKYPLLFEELRKNKKTRVDYDKLQQAFTIDFAEKDPKTGITPLMIVAQLRNLNLVLYILSKIPLEMINTQDNDGNTALIHILKTFIELQNKQYDKSNAQQVLEHSLLLKEARKIAFNLIDKVKAFDNGSGLILANRAKQTPDVLAKLTKDEELIKALAQGLSDFAKFEKENPKPKNSVFKAAKAGNYADFKVWIETYKANPNTPQDTKKNKTLLIIVAKKIDKDDKLLKEREMMIDDLLEANADANAVETEFGNTALMWILQADFKGREAQLKSIALKLIEHMNKKGLEVQNIKFGDSALHILARNNDSRSIPLKDRIELINAITNKGATTKQKNSAGRGSNTPLGVAKAVYAIDKEDYEADQRRLHLNHLPKTEAKVLPPDDTIVKHFQEIGEQ